MGYQPPYADEDDDFVQRDLPRALATAYRRQTRGDQATNLALALALAGDSPPQAQTQNAGGGDFGLGALGSLTGAEDAGGGGALGGGGGIGGILGGGASSGGGGMWGGFGGSMSPWDAVFSTAGRAHGAYVGNDPNTPMVPHGRQPVGDDWLIKAGAPIGGAVGSIFGFGGSGALAGQNVGATLADLKNGNIHNLGLDVSQNLPPLPGMQQPGWKGLLNGATGLPVGTLFGKLFG